MSNAVLGHWAVLMLGWEAWAAMLWFAGWDIQMPGAIGRALCAWYPLKWLSPLFPVVRGPNLATSGRVRRAPKWLYWICGVYGKVDVLDARGATLQLAGLAVGILGPIVVVMFPIGSNGYIVASTLLALVPIALTLLVAAGMFLLRTVFRD